MTTNLGEVTTGGIRIMDHTGDRDLIRWNKDRPASVEVAKKTFAEYKAKGYTMFVLDENEVQGERLTEFDPKAEGILAVPRMAGG